MSDHHHPRLHHPKSTPQLLRLASFSSASNLLTFLFLTLHIFSFRTVVENGTHLLTAFIDRDLFLKSLLSCLELAASRYSPTPTDSSPSPLTLRRCHRPFLHLTRFRTLDDYFFYGDDDDSRSSNNLFGSHCNAPIFIFSHFSSSKLGFNGFRVSDMAPSSLSFKAEQFRDTNTASEEEAS